MPKKQRPHLRNGIGIVFRQQVRVEARAGRGADARRAGWRLEFLGDSAELIHRADCHAAGEDWRFWLTTMLDVRSVNLMDLAASLPRQADA